MNQIARIPCKPVGHERAIEKTIEQTQKVSTRYVLIYSGFFLERVRGDYDGAEEMYLRALNVKNKKQMQASIADSIGYCHAR